METTRDRKWAYGLCLGLIVALAAALRLVGLRWGLPDALHDYSYHPDEFFVIGAAYGTIILQRTLLPRFYQYPSLYIYLSAVAISVAIGYGAQPTSANIYLAARVMTALMGTAAVAVTYWAGSVLWGRGAGLLAALILCIAPLHVQQSHFATVDVPSTLFVAAALGFAGLVLKRGSWRDYLVGGLMCGFAAGVKYNAGLVMFSIIAAHFLRGKSDGGKSATSRLLAAIGCAACGFVISTPGCILQSHEFLHGLTYEMHHVSTGHGLVFAGTGNGFLYTLTHSLWYGLGPLTIIFLFALVTAFAKRDKRVWAMLAFLLPYYALISLSEVRFARYVMPMLPGIALLCGWVINDWLAAVAARRKLAAFMGVTAVCFTFLMVFSTLVIAIVLDAAFVLPPPQEAVARWALRHIPKGSSIGMVDPPWFYSPPLSKDFGFGTLDLRREAAARSPYKIVIFSDCEKPGCWFAPGKAPQWVILTDYETEDAIRLRGNRSISREDQTRVKAILLDLEIVRRHYTFRTGFGGLMDFLDFKGWPHDMRYADPLIKLL